MVQKIIFAAPKKVAIVAGGADGVGGSSTIGSAIAQRLSKEYDVIIIDQYGGDIQLRITQDNNGELITQLGTVLKDRTVTLLVNCMATYGDHVSIMDNVNPYIQLFDAIVEMDKFASDFHVVNIGSISSDFAKKGQRNYTIAKAAIDGFTKSLTAEGHRCNTVSPGYVKIHNSVQNMENKDIVDLYQTLKKHNPMETLVEVEDVAEVVYMLDKCVAICGQNIRVDHGQSVTT